MPRYVVIACSTPLGDQYLDDGAIVSADGPDEACAEAARWIRAEQSDLDPDYLNRMYAIEFGDFTIWERTDRYEPSGGPACCGGSTWTDDGHTGSCPERSGPDDG